jgi:hypothetical protein
VNDPLRWWPGKYADCKRIGQLVEEFMPGGEVLESGSLEIFSSLLPQHRITTARIADGIDLCHLPYEDGRFDVGVSARVIEILPPALRRDYLLELLRVSRYRAYVALPLQPELEAIDKIKIAYIWDTPRLWSHPGLAPQELDALLEHLDVCVSYHVDTTATIEPARLGTPRELLGSLLATSATPDTKIALASWAVTPAVTTPAYVIAEIVKTNVAPLELSPFSQAAH